MAIASNCVWEVRTTGSDNNGGGYVPGGGGTDRSQQDAAFANGTNLTVHASANTDVLPDGYTPVAADVGNIVHITAGAGFSAGFYEIKSIQSGYWRLDRSPAAVGTSGGTWYMGGAVASLGAISGLLVTGQKAFVKYGTYTITTTSSNVSGGRIDTGAQKVVIHGYDTNRSVTAFDANRPTLKIQAGLTSFSIFSGYQRLLSNFVLDGNGQTGTSGVDNGVAYRCHFTGFADGFLQGRAVWCTATGNTRGFGYNSTCWYCDSYGNSSHGYTDIGWGVFYCISRSNGGHGFGRASTAIGCLAYGNTQKGFVYNDNAPGVYANCIAANNGEYGFDLSQYGVPVLFVNCAGYLNTSGNNLWSDTVSVGYISVTDGSPFVNAAGGDFSLNSTPLRGALLRSAGFPATMGATPNYADVGPVRHQDPAGSGAMILARLLTGM